jgi:hypothetical protein
MDQKTDNQGPAQPGTPLEPDELPPSPPDFQPGTQSKRAQTEVPAAHPTSELSSTPSHKRGPIAPAGKHPTSELHIKPKGRR